MSDDFFQQLVDHYHGPLYRFAYSLSRSESAASDLTQQTFYIWATKGQALRDPTKAKSWLFTTLHREFLRSRQRDQRWSSLEDLPPASVDLQDEKVETWRKLDGAAVMDALLEVDEIFRIPLSLFYLEDFSYAEIAETLGIPKGTVMSRLSRGKQQLRERLHQSKTNAPSTIINLPTTSKKGAQAV